MKLSNPWFLWIAETLYFTTILLLIYDIYFLEGHKIIENYIYMAS